MLADLVVEQATEVLPQYLEILLLVVDLVQEIVMVLMQEDQVDLVVVEHIKLHQEEVEIVHL